MRLGEVDMLKPNTQLVKTEHDLLIDQFENSTIDKKLAFNFLLGVFRTYLNKEKDIPPETLISILESSLRFGKIR